jgi:hypothetical protein
MRITWDLLGKLLLSLPFTLILVGNGVYVLIVAWEERSPWKKIGLALGALAIMAVGVGITVMIVTTGHWCTGSHRDECTQVGGG